MTPDTDSIGSDEVSFLIAITLSWSPSITSAARQTRPGEAKSSSPQLPARRLLFPHQLRHSQNLSMT